LRKFFIFYLMYNYNLSLSNGGFQISTPVFQNNSIILLNEATQAIYSPLLQPTNSLIKMKSPENLLKNNCEIQIANQLKLSKSNKHIYPNIEINQENIEKTLINPIETNELPIKAKENIDNTIQNKSKDHSFSDGFLVKKEKIAPKEEDVVSDELQKAVIKSPFIVRINQKNLTQTLMSLESKKQFLIKVKRQNELLKRELKKKLEKKIRLQAVESLLIENKALTSLLTYKLYENIRLNKNNNLIEEYEVNNPELTKLKEKNETFVKLLQIIKDIDEKKNKLSKLKEEIQIKEMTYHIGLLNKSGGGNMEKIGERMQILPLKIEELFSLIKIEFKKKEEICVN